MMVLLLSLETSPHSDDDGPNQCRNETREPMIDLEPPSNSPSSTEFEIDRMQDQTKRVAQNERLPQ